MEFRVLGPLEVWSEEARIALPGARHQRALAALLLAPNRVVSIAGLMAAMWNDEPPATAVKQVQNCVSALRERLGCGSDVIVTDGPGYRVVLTDDELDMLRFQRGFDRARGLAAEAKLDEAVAEARRALRLWRGPALHGLEADALVGSITRLDEQRTDAAALCLDWRLQLGESHEVVGELTELVAQHPLNERLHARLMTALDRSGRQADALAVFHDVRGRLVEELGVDPGAELQQSYTDILAGAERRASSSSSTTSTATHADVAATEPRSLPLARAKEHLAVAVRRQWTDEAEMRSLNRPEPVALRWSRTARPVSGVAAALPAERPPAQESGQLVFSGELAEIAGAFRSIQPRQLVVLGEPGAGKTVVAMLLTLSLLADRQPDEPVPVLFPLASWDPRREHLHTWMSGKLAEEYPGLANKAAYGPDAAARLVLDGEILPVLDGLDEMPPALHAEVINALDQAVAGGRPVVVTCRSAEYEFAVTRSGSMLAQAAVVEIEAVRLEDAVTYLTARARVGETRWDPLVAHLRENPHGALAQALRTPLMVDLARTAHAHPDTHPAELCDTERFADAEAVEEHLLDTYIPAAYASRPAPPLVGPERYPRRRPYDQDQAGRWLGFLARHLEEQHTHDIAWWRLNHAVARRTASLYLSLPPAMLFTIAGQLADGPVLALIYGLSFAIAGCAAHRIGHHPGALRVELRFPGTAGPFLRRFAVGAGIAVCFGLGWSLPGWIIALLAVDFGLAIAFHVWLTTPADAARVSSPTAVLLHDRTAAWAFTVSFVMCLGPFYSLAFAYTRQTRFVPILHGHFDLVLALASGVPCALLGRFMLGKAGLVAYSLAGAVVGGQVFPRATHPGQAVIAGTAFGVAVGLAVCLTRAWGTFTLTRSWLALRGRLPWQIMRFLDDAHSRGVLRQVGGVYQFRHSRLQSRLAAQASTRASSKD